jgi:regulator of protease activity HflC (stomatin/prohibitin superfamily)
MTEVAPEAEPSGPWAQAAEWAFRFLFLMVCGVAVFWSISNIRSVPADSQAVVFRFGQVDRVVPSGLLLAWPKPIETIVLVPRPERQIEFPIKRFDQNYELEAGTSTGEGQTFTSFDVSSDPRWNTGFLLTGDSSIVHLQATVFYQIADAASYVIAAEHVAPALDRLFVASAVRVCAGRDLDSILVARPESASQPAEAAARERLRSDLVGEVNRRLDDLARQGVGLGIHVSRVDLAAAIPTGAKMAFDQVLVATQSAETGIAMARTQAELRTQATNQQRDRLITDATAESTEIVTAAKEQTAAIAALGQQSQGMSHTMLLNRLYYDRVGPLLRKAGRVETVDPKGTVHMILPGTGQP